MLMLSNAKLERLERILIRLRISRNYDLEGNFTTFIIVVVVVVVPG